MRTFRDHGHELKIFDSAGELADRCGLDPPQKNDDALGCLLDRSFAGRKFDSFTEAGAALHKRWDEGLTVLDRMRGELTECKLPQPKSRRRRLRWDEAAGDEVDFDRLRAGQEYWRTSHRATTAGPATRTICVDMGANCSIDADDILWRGAVAIVLTEALEEAGYRVELWAYSRAARAYPSSQDASGAFLACQLKATSDPLDPSTLVNALSGWFFRTNVLHERCISEQKVSGSLGSHQEATTELLDHLTPDAERIVIQGVWNYAAAVKLLRETLTKMA